jgi:cytochrome c oxidase subunit IV
MSNVEYKDQETYLYENAQEKLYHAESHGTKEIWRIFGLLTVITFIDILLYFVLDASMGRNILFIALGIVKAVLIVGYFMHLKHERVNLILTVTVPMMFVVFFIIWMLYEGNFWSTFNH